MEMQLQLPAIEDSELIAAQAAETLGKALALSEDSIEGIRLALVEACLNAAEHGGGAMTVRMATEDRRLRIEVEDHGPGFDPDCIDATSPTRVQGCVEKRGWGLRLIREMMDEIAIESRPGRTIIRMWKELPAAGKGE